MGALQLVPTYDAGPVTQVIPIDPESLDATRPDDVDACTVCIGAGYVTTFVDGEGQDDECWACQGTTIRGAA